MQEQNFEKQVQQKMDELSFTPSAPVWQNVEHQIRKKKDRRRVLFFWLFPLLLAGSGAFLWFSQSQFYKSYSENKQSSVTTKQLPGSNPVETTQQDIPAPSLNNNSIKVQSPEPSNQPVQIGMANTLKNRKVIKNNVSKPYHRKGQQTLPNKSIASSKTTKTPHITKQPSNKQVNPVVSESDPIGITATSQNKLNTTTLVDSEPNTLDKPNVVTDSTENTALKPLEIANPVVDSTSIKKRSDKTPKWSWAIQGTYGISSAQTQLLDRAGQVELAARPAIVTNGAVASTPSRLQNGYAYSFGALTKMTLKKRLTVNTGLNYTFLSTKNSVGQPANRDTVLQFADLRANVSQYYRRGETKEYKNNYHFLELPIGVEWQLHRRLPLHFQTGISLAYLFSTNALMYDPNTGIFYQSKEVFTRTQLHANTALTYRIWRQKTKGIHIGPFMQYGITGLHKQKQNDNYHLFAAGLKAQFSF